MNGKRIFVTGANGFLGSWICKILSKENEVTGLVRNLENIDFLKKHEIAGDISLVEGDISSLNRVDTGDIDYGIHLAAMTDVLECTKEPSRALEVNARGTHHALEFFRKRGARGIITASSTKVYGNVKEPVTEDAIPLPLSMYGLTKSYGDYISMEFSRRHAIPCTVARLSNIYGPFDLNDNRIVPQTIERILADKQPIVWGGGVVKRDFVYIEDVVDFFLIALEKLERGIFNVGVGERHSVAAVVEEIGKLLNWKGGTEQKDATLPQRSDNKISTEKARALGWEPKTPLGEGLKRIVQTYGVNL